MTSKSSKSIPFVVLGITGLLLAVDVYTGFTIHDRHIEIILVMMGTFGMGGLYKKVITRGFEAFKSIKKDRNI